MEVRKGGLKMNPNRPFFVALIKALTDGKGTILLMTNEDWVVEAFPSKEKALTYFESTYEAAHRRGHIGSASACISYMFFQPSIVGVANIEDLKTRFVPDEKNVKLLVISGDTNSFYGIDVTHLAGKSWEDGVKPQLVAGENPVELPEAG